VVKFTFEHDALPGETTMDVFTRIKQHLYMIYLAQWPKLTVGDNIVVVIALTNEAISGTAFPSISRKSTC